MTNLSQSVSQFSRSVVFDSLRSHELQHTRPPCLSPTPGVHSNSRPLESVMPSSHLILCRPLLLLPPIPPSIRVFSNKSTLRMRWPKYWSFSFSIIPSKKHPGPISFRMDWSRQHIKKQRQKKSRDIILPTKICLVKAMVFPVVTCGCES